MVHAHPHLKTVSSLGFLVLRGGRKGLCLPETRTVEPGACGGQSQLYQVCQNSQKVSDMTSVPRGQAGDTKWMTITKASKGWGHNKLRSQVLLRAQPIFVFFYHQPLPSPGVCTLFSALQSPLRNSIRMKSQCAEMPEGTCLGRYFWLGLNSEVLERMFLTLPSGNL